MLVAVVGMGYVGIPVAVRLAESGPNLIGIEINRDKVSKINNGIYPIEGDEPEIREKLSELVANKKIQASTEYSDASDADAWIICVQTPFDVQNFRPNLSALRGSLESISKVMKEGALVVVESTIPPGTMEEVVAPTLESSSGLSLGKQFHLGHCPERVMPGKLLHNLSTYDRVLGGFDAKSHELMTQIYRRITSGKLSLVGLKTAEVVKTFENTYRDAEIAIANDFAKYCDSVGVDFYQVRELVNVVESRNLHLPGGGVGGHCIPKDTWLLAYGSRNRYSPEFLIKAREINDSMPSYISSKIFEGMKKFEINPTNCKVSILGLSYLEESDDVRNSPTVDLVNELVDRGLKVSVHDPFVQNHPSIHHNSDLEETLSGADILVIMVAHHLYESLNPETLEIQMRGKLLIDARNVLETNQFVDQGFAIYSIGRGSSWD